MAEARVAWRVRLGWSVVATGAGWLAATLMTLPFEWVELWRNAPAGAHAQPMVEGSGLWAVFTLGVCAAVWCVLALPLALAAPARLVLGWGRELLVGSPALAVVVIGWRLDLWRDLMRERGPESPFARLLLWEYWLFGAVLAFVTTWVYVRRIERLTRARVAP